MLRFLVSQLRHRSSRAVALGAGILVAAVSFVLLASAARTSELRVRGSVRTNFRTAYDVLVRPRGSFTQLERSRGLVRDNYLSGIYGGISFKQYAQVRRIRGVSIAAPIANVGLIMPFQAVTANLDGLLTDDPFQLYRVTPSWTAQNGLSRYPGGGSEYVYFTRRDRFVEGPREVVPGGGRLPVCFGAMAGPITGPFDPDAGFLQFCYSARSKTRFGFPGFVGAGFGAYFPILVSAIDPVQEARLLHLDRTMVGGRYLREGEGEAVKTFADPHNPLQKTSKLKFVPVIASGRSYVRENLNVSIERLRIPPGTNVPQTLASGTCEIPSIAQCPADAVVPRPAGSPYRNAYDFLTGLDGRVVSERSYPVRRVYSRLLRGLFQAGRVDFKAYWTTSPVGYRVLGRNLIEPLPVTNPASIWTDEFEPLRGSVYQAPPDNRDVQFRRLHEHAGNNDFAEHGYGPLNTPRLRVVGTFDPRKLPGFSPLSKVPLETYYPPTLEPGDAAAARALGGRPLLPDQNLGDYIAQPPLMLTTLSGLKSFVNPHDFSNLPRREIEAPISVIRVRVAGVTGPDPLSRLRIRTVALKIHEQTGLDVDIAAGSSPHELQVRLPAGKFGRPQLLLREGWVKKGVSVRFLNAVDRKDLALFALILVICGFFLANGAFAATRARRSEIGTLLTLGWSQGEIFRSVLGELALIGLIAGLVGTGLAAGLVDALSLELRLVLTLLVLPIAVCLASASGLVPAWRAARSTPLDAIRPPVSGSTHGRRVRGTVTMALVNLRRLPSRTVVGAAGLLIGVAALTVLTGIERAFQGTLVGTLLGNAISLQIRGVDFVAIGLTIALAALSVADVLYLNLRERQAELVTLRTVGWSDRELVVLVGLEALFLGLLGSVVGAGVGLLLGALLLGVPLGALGFAAAVGVGGGAAAALLASVLPLSRIQRLTVPAVLAAE